MRRKTAVVAIILLSALFGSAEAGEPAPAPRSGPAPGVAMNDFYLNNALRGMTDKVEGGDGRWQFTLFDVDLIMISDETAGRMRVITPVAGAGTLDREQLRLLMEVNFDRAPDVDACRARSRREAGDQSRPYLRDRIHQHRDGLRAGRRRPVGRGRRLAVALALDPTLGLPLGRFA